MSWVSAIDWDMVSAVLTLCGAALVGAERLRKKLTTSVDAMRRSVDTLRTEIAGELADLRKSVAHEDAEIRREMRDGFTEAKREAEARHAKLEDRMEATLRDVTSARLDLVELRGRVSVLEERASWRRRLAPDSEVPPTKKGRDGTDG